MASSEETGNAKNVANLDSLISSLNAAGATYNPVRTNLTTPSLQNLLTQSRTSVENVTNFEKSENTAIAQRKMLVGDYKKYATSIVNALAGCGASESKIAEATTIKRKIQGTRATAPEKPTADAPAGETPKQRNTMHATFDSILENFKSLAGTLKTEPLYTPNEADITLEAINTYNDNFLAANKSVNDATALTSAARTNRNIILYAPETGLIAVVTGVKKYLRSVSALKDTYKAAIALKFRLNIK
jgi:hypothetical protein